MHLRPQDYQKELREGMRGGKGTVELTHLAMACLPDNCRIFTRITLEPGASIGGHVHEQETELFYFLSGSGEVEDDGEIRAVQAGDTLVTGNGHSHGVTNTGDVPLAMLAVIVKDPA